MRWFHNLSIHCTVGRMTVKSTCRVLGHLLIRSLVRSHRSLIRLLRTAPSAHAPLRSFVNLFTHSFAPEIMGKSFISMNWIRRFYTISTHSFRWCFYVTGLRPSYFFQQRKEISPQRFALRGNRTFPLLPMNVVANNYGQKTFTVFSRYYLKQCFGSGSGSGSGGSGTF